MYIYMYTMHVCIYVHDVCAYVCDMYVRTYVCMHVCITASEDLQEELR